VVGHLASFHNLAIVNSAAINMGTTIAILTGVRWNFSVVLICISFLVKDDNYSFMCFLAIWVSSFEKVLFSSVAHFFISSLIRGKLDFELPVYSTYQSFV
jgi:hypothetical protein